MAKKIFLLTVIACLSTASLCTANSTPSSVAPKPSIAKICLNCHKAEAGVLRGSFDNVAFKAKTIQIKIDDSVELIKFDEDEIKVVNGEGKIGDGEFLKDNKVKKGHEVRVDYVVKDGIKNVVKFIEKPPVKISEEMLVSTADIEKLVAQGTEKGGYFLFDSRPLPRFQEGSIPTAINLPFPAFDKLADKLLPKDKNALIIFYCAGPTCNMSPGSAVKAQKLGYKNLKVYKDGMPSWLEKNYGVLSPQSLKEAWIDKNIPHVLLDVRAVNESENGFISGAVAFPASRRAELVKGLDLKKNVPIFVYDKSGGGEAASVASALVTSGFKKVVVLSGGFNAWQTAKYEVASGKLAEKASYQPKPRQGEISIDEFKKYAKELPANVMIIDVRNADEVVSGMLKTAKLIPAEEIKDRAIEISREKLVVTLCSTGVRSEMAYHTLKELGYPNVKFLNAKVDFEKNGNYKITKE